MDLSGHGHEGEVPVPIKSTYIVHHHHSSSSTKATTKPPPHSLSSTIITKEEEEEEEQSKKKNVRYRECLKNHAASMGRNSTDGCCEFMPSGEEGSLEALKCLACSCHKNFHRKEVEGDHGHDLHHYNYNYNDNHSYKPRSASALVGYIQRPHPPPPALIMPLGTIHTSESDDVEDGYGFLSHPPQRTMMTKKRFRTKFSQEQKEKMLGFAERVGWKLQRQEEGEVQKLCQEIGVKRRVLKVWMHNNKHNYLAKKNTTTAAPLVQ